MSPYYELFIIGLTLSFGPCLAYCSQIIIPYIAATNRGLRQGLGAILIFSSSRLLAYAILGFLVGSLGRLFTEQLSRYNLIIELAAGLFISILGILLIFGKDIPFRFCKVLRSHTVESRVRSLITLGLIVGFMPCLPLLGVLSYIALLAKSSWQGTLFAISFGIGVFISPVIILAPLASTLPQVIFRNYRVFDCFRRICGLLLFLVGIRLIIP